MMQVRILPLPLHLKLPAMAHITTKERYEILLQQWAERPLLGQHVVGDLTIQVTHMRWTISCKGTEVKTGTIRSNKGAREAIKKAVMSWLKPQLR